MPCVNRPKERGKESRTGGRSKKEEGRSDDILFASGGREGRSRRSAARRVEAGQGALFGTGGGRPIVLSRL